MRVYYLALKYWLISHIKLRSGLVVDLTKVQEMTITYANIVKKIISSTLNSDHLGNQLISLCEISTFTQKLGVPILDIKKCIWEGLNRYFVILSKYTIWKLIERRIQMKDCY